MICNDGFGRANIICGSLLFLSSDLTCGEKTASRASRTAHGMFMTGFVKVRLKKVGKMRSEQ